MEEFNDKLHDIIKSRLAERDRKSQSIKRWSRNKSNVNLRPIIGFVAAACLAGVLFIIPWSNVPEDTSGVRAASGNIEELIRLEKYEDALILIEKEIISSDSTLQVMEHDTCAIDEETEYNISAIKLKISNLKEKRDFISKKLVSKGHFYYVSALTCKSEKNRLYYSLKKKNMKKRIIMMVMAVLSTASIFAQSAKELAKQQQELNEINMRLLNSKPSKDAKKQEKKLVKDGWQVPAGGKSIAKQITETQLLGEELMADEVGNPTKRYIIRSAQSIAGTFNAGVATARTNAQVELAAMLETKVAAALEGKLDNQQTSAITANTVEKFHERAKAIIDASLTNTRTVLSIYRVNMQNNYEVQVQVAFDKKELAARLKRNIQKELEQEGDEDLNDIVDYVLSRDL